MPVFCFVKAYNPSFRSFGWIWGQKYALEDGRYFPKSSFVHDSDNSSGIWPRRFIPSEVAVNLCARPYIATRIMSIFHWSFEYPCISIGELGALSRPSPPGCNHRTMRFQTGTGIFDSQSCKLTCDNRKVKFRIVRDDQFDSKFPQIIREIRQNLRKQLTLANSPSGRDAMHGRGLRWLGLSAIHPRYGHYSGLHTVAAVATFQDNDERHIARSARGNNKTQPIRLYYAFVSGPDDQRRARRRKPSP